MVKQSAVQEPSGDILELKYVYVKDMIFLAGNAKLHAEDRIMASIRENGFRDPAAWDSAVGALIEGNGRLAVLQSMIADKLTPPRGIKVDSEGLWLMPVLFGCDAQSEAQAQRYAIDHNMTVAFGGGFGVSEVAQMYDPIALAKILDGLKVDEMPASLNGKDELKQLLGLLNMSDRSEPELQLGSPGDYAGTGASASNESDSADQSAAGKDDDADLLPPPASTVRMLQLFLNVETYPKMLQMLESLMLQYNAANPTDCIFAVVSDVFNQRQGAE